jgi:hypothetical protein
MRTTDRETATPPTPSRWLPAALIGLACAVALGIATLAAQLLLQARSSEQSLSEVFARAFAARTARQAFAATRPGLLFEADEAGSAASVTGARTSHYGGLPTRFEGEEWPRNAAGTPLSFLGEIVRDDESAPFMGRVALLRVFVDIEALYWGRDDDVLILSTA